MSAESRKTPVDMARASLSQTTQDVYAAYYARQGADRNSLMANAGVLLQSMAMDLSMLRALRRMSSGVDFTKARILEVGSGRGDGFLHFFKGGCAADQLWGIDIIEDRVSDAKKRFPGSTFLCGDARFLPPTLPDFDIVFESTIFLQITDDRVARDIAQEMIRVTKPGGFLIICDWRYSKPGSKEYYGVSQKRIRNLFDVGTKTRRVKVFNGALVPPIGRFLSKWASPLYFPVQFLFPFLVGQQTTLLQKVKD